MIDTLHAWHVAERLALIFAVAAICSAAVIVVLRPLLMRYALARPNARSSHREPTPQGGGIAVIAATTAIVAGAVVFLARAVWRSWQFPSSSCRTRRPWPSSAPSTTSARSEAVPRLVAAGAAVAIGDRGAAGRIAHRSGLAVVARARSCSLVGTLWFVNLVNFMDGIDWMTVAEVVPHHRRSGVVRLSWARCRRSATLVALALCGAMIGFAPFNRPVARLFLGDVGSLPIGLLLGWLLVMLAGNGHLAAALLLPLYYLADTTVTLLRRLVEWRAGHAGAPQPFLSAGHGSRLQRPSNRRPRVARQYRLDCARGNDAADADISGARRRVGRRMFAGRPAACPFYCGACSARRFSTMPPATPTPNT